jgi:hypothetical protein
MVCTCKSLLIRRSRSTKVYSPEIISPALWRLLIKSDIPLRRHGGESRRDYGETPILMPLMHLIDILGLA